MSPRRVIADVVCPGCGCLCDDLRVEVQGNRVTKIAPDCPLAEAWFQRLDRRDPTAVLVDGRAAAAPVAIARAVEILRQARAPLIYGLAGSSTAGQRAAVRLAEKLGAIIDTAASSCHAPSIVAFQQVGESTCSLGEVRNRADLVIYWGCDPSVSHPRHMERYALEPTGLFVPDGRAGRTLVVVDVRPTATSQQADLFLKVGAGQDFELIWTLRALLRGIELTPSPGTPCSAEQRADLLSRMKSCRFGVAFFGRGLACGPTGHATVQALLQLVTDLNAHTRFHAKRMRVYGDVSGADSVLCWQTGFPFAVNLNRGYPRYGPNEYTANVLLERGEIDACLLVGTDGVDRWSAAARDHLHRIPTICLDHEDPPPSLPTNIFIRTAVCGAHVGGTAFRMDEVPLEMKSFVASPWPSDGDVLLAMLAQR